ncbi:MAG: DNA cytosine methyltransferase [Muribaculaceae bacterium]
MKVVSLFSGCGGLDYGFEKAGYDVIWANEIDKTISSTYKLNHKNTILETRDIRELLNSDIPDCDGIIGGPPCQSWSEGGKGRGIEDERGRLFLDYIRIVCDKKPKFFLIENVKGILEDKHSEVFNMFLRKLYEADYDVTYALVNCADYRIPQDRFRVFIMGIQNQYSKYYLFPNPVESEKVTLKEAIGDIIVEPTKYLNELVVENERFSNHDVYVGPYDAKFMARNRVRSWNEVSFTIQAQAKNEPLHPQAPKMVYKNKNERIFAPGNEHLYRRLSVRECARIQTFPDSFRFIYSNIQDGYKMVGNAVPPRMAKFLAEQLKIILKI